MRTLFFIPIIAFTIGSAAQSRPPSATRPNAESVDLCAAVSHPDTYVGHRISLDVDVLADGMHGSVLISSKCERGVVPDFTNAEALGREYEKAIFTGHPGTIDKTIHATFAGVLRYEACKEGMCYGHMIYVLYVDSMEHLTVTPKPFP